jgi:hypothetical protein
MSLSRATSLSLTHIQNCPLDCPVMKLPMFVWGLTIMSSASFVSIYYLMSNYTNQDICDTLNINYYPTYYRVMPKIYWYIFTVAIPRSMWEGVKAGAYAAVYPGIWMYHTARRMIAK